VVARRRRGSLRKVTGSLALLIRLILFVGGCPGGRTATSADRGDFVCGRRRGCTADRRPALRGMPVSERRSAATVIGRRTRAGSPAGTHTTGLGPGNGASRCGARSRPGPGSAAPRPAGRARARHKPPGRRAGAWRGNAGRHSLQTSRHLQFPVLQPRRRGGFLREPGERRSAHGGMGLLGACLVDRAHQLARG